MDTTDPTCFRCVALERKIYRLRAEAGQLVEDNTELESDNRSLKRAVKRQRLQLDALEDQVAALTREEAP